MPVPFPLVTTFETAGTYKKWLWPNSAYITLRGMRYYYGTRTSIHIYIYTYRISSNLYTPDSVSLARQLLAVAVVTTHCIPMLPVRTRDWLGAIKLSTRSCPGEVVASAMEMFLVITCIIFVLCYSSLVHGDRADAFSLQG